MSSLHWFPMYPDAWLSSFDVQKMTSQQKGWYIDLLCHQWNQEGVLKADEAMLASICRVDTHSDLEMKLFSDLLLMFPKNKDGLRSNERLLEVYLEQKDKHDKRKKNGRKGGSSKNLAKIKELESSSILLFSSSQDQSVEFKETWRKWISFRIGCKKMPAKPEQMFQEQLEWLAQYPIESQVEVINKSIRNDWQGLFEPSTKPATPARQTFQLTPEDIAHGAKSIDPITGRKKY